MANHGVVSYGSDLQSAYMKMETVEHFAQITLITRMLGQQQLLECGDLDKLVAARSRYLGVNSAARMPVHASNGNSESRTAEDRHRTRRRSSLRQSETAPRL
jgi:L-fuculose-phosphate aldolase